jgi:hypothetical protein
VILLEFATRIDPVRLERATVKVMETFPRDRRRDRRDIPGSGRSKVAGKIAKKMAELRNLEYEVTMLNFRQFRAGALKRAGRHQPARPARFV